MGDLHSDRLTIETGFQRLTDEMRCEIDTLGYPKGGVVRILHGMCGVQRGVCGESGDSRGIRQEVR